MSAPLRNLVLTGGVGHPFAQSARTLANGFVADGYPSDVTDDIEAGLRVLERGEHRVATLYALRWSMTTGEKYAPLRAEWGFDLSPRGRRALTAHVSGGGGLLILHTGVICFDTWPEFLDLAGGLWRWGRSAHPPRGPVRVEPTATDHPIMAGIGPFNLAEDEVYAELEFLPDVPVLATARATEHARGAWPAVWARAHGSGRVVCDTLGHDGRSLEVPQHRRLLANAMRWLAE